jgi:molecular chaperone HscB
VAQFSESQPSSTVAPGPFAVLGIEPRFDLDLVAAGELHRELSRALHPDRFVGAPAGERRQALNKAIAVNEAWRIVKDPVRRAEALLQHFGVTVTERNDPKASPALLMEMMEAREELGTLRANAQATQLSVWRARQEQRRDAVCTTLAERFTTAAASGDFTAVRETLVELRYLQRLLEEARNAEDDL